MALRPTASCIALLLVLGPAALATPAEAPGSQDGADVYYGAVAIRSTVNGYVLAVSGEWGSRSFFFRSLEPVEPLELFDRNGKAVYRPRELLVSLPESETLLRLVVPNDDETDPNLAGSFQPLAGGERALLLERYRAERLVEEVEGFELAMTGSVRPGLGTEDLLGYTATELGAALRTARGAGREPGLEVFAHPYFNQTPPDEPNGGANACTAGGRGSDSCSKTCGSTGDSCTVSCRSAMTYSCCYCHGGTAYCVCRLSWP